jgi:hypothetical protein
MMHMVYSVVVTPKSIEFAKMGAMLPGGMGVGEGATYPAFEYLRILLSARCKVLREASS